MTNADSVEPPADTMRERAEESGLKIRILISANRWVVTAGITVGTFLLLVILGAVGPNGIERILTGDGVTTVFGSVIIAIVTSVTLVLTIAQLVLSEQIDELGKHRSHLEGEIQFREQVGETSGASVPPAEPAAFLQTLLATVETYAGEIESAVRESDDEEEFAEIRDYTESVIRHSRKVGDDLDGAEFGSFDVLMPILNYNYSWKLYAARKLHSEYADAVPAAADDSFEELITALQFLAPAREYFKSQYYQWEIINTSRSTLYGAMPALAVAGYVVLVFNAGNITGSTFGVSAAYVVVSGIYALTLLPFSVLLAYVLRILTIQKWTLAIGPFILRETEAGGVSDAE